MKTIAASSDGLVRVFEIIYDIDDKIKFSYNNGPIETATIDYSGDESPTFKVGELEYSMSEICNLNEVNK